MKTLVKSLVLAGLGALILAGCIVTGTFVITKKIDDFDVSSAGNFHAELVDVTQDEIWQDHKDNIKNISDVRFRANIENVSGNPAIGSIYFSKNGSYVTPDEVREATDVIIVFSGFGVEPLDETILTFAESADYRQNLDQALKMLESGTFYMYALTPEGAFSLEFTKVYVLLVLDAGK